MPLSGNTHLVSGNTHLVSGAPALIVPAALASDLGPGTRREWLETNGLGSFAMGTVAGPATRRYHSLLCVATEPPSGRMVLVNRLEESLVIDGAGVEARHELSTNYYPGAIHPDGHRLISGFRLDPWPVWTFQVGPLTLERSIFMPHERQETVICYRLLGESRGRVQLKLRPLISGRDYHALHRENLNLRADPEIADGVVRFRPYEGVPCIALYHNASYTHDPCWYRRFQYPVEAARGLEFEEDLFSPGELTFELSSAEALLVLRAEVTSASEAAPEMVALRNRERIRRAALVDMTEGDLGAPRSGLSMRLNVAAAQFIVRRGTHRTVIAGYPWFTDWGRDTFISLPGLMLLKDGLALARELLLAFAPFISKGLIPNRFPDGKTAPEYNAVDAPLWYVLAACRYARSVDDPETVDATIVQAVQQILDGYLAGTSYGIGLDDDGLIHAAYPGVQLTWMDAKVGDWVVTPRAGKPVEIQALWIAALEAAARLFGERRPTYARELEERAAWARSSFAAAFWDESLGYLYDLIDGPRRDPTLRPNQLYALGLCRPLVDQARAERALKACERELKVPFGLRTRGRGIGYHGQIVGDQRARDGAYHEGTVWPYLLGVYADACIRVRGQLPEDLLDGVTAHVMGDGLGTIHEIFDGDAPHEPRGCPAQAWSVAEILRVSLGRVGEDA